jgi:hypothetical protein
MIVYVAVVVVVAVIAEIVRVFAKVVRAVTHYKGARDSLRLL